MPRTIPLRPGQAVVVQHGREALSGVVVAAVEHPAFGPCVDVEVGGRVRRFVADRVSPTEERKGRRTAKSDDPLNDVHKKSLPRRAARQAAQWGGAQ